MDLPKYDLGSNPDLPKNSKCYKAYTVQSRSELLDLRDKIVFR